MQNNDKLRDVTIHVRDISKRLCLFFFHSKNWENINIWAWNNFPICKLEYSKTQSPEICHFFWSDGWNFFLVSQFSISPYETFK